MIVSVIMSVRDSEKTVVSALSSMVAQTLRKEEMEILVIDDGSTDHTFERLKTYARKHDIITVFRRDKSIGLTKNLNYLIKKADGKYIARMDADDWSCAARLQDQVYRLAAVDADVCWSNIWYMSEEGRIICRGRDWSEDQVLDALPTVNRIVHSSVMFRRATIIEAGGYNEGFKSGQDVELWNRLQLRGANFIKSSKYLHMYRIGECTVTAKRVGFPSDMECVYSRVAQREGRSLVAFRYLIRCRNIRYFLSNLARIVMGRTTVEILRKLKKGWWDRVGEKVSSWLGRDEETGGGASEW